MTVEYVKRQDSSTYMVVISGIIVGSFYVETDGFYVFEPSKRAGYWSEYMLVELSRKLQQLNKPAQEQLDAYFEKQQK